jgi:hypothetical protein
MGKIHLIPTDKPSRLIFNLFHKSFCYQKEIDGKYINDGKVSGADFWGLQKALNNGFKPQNIYITSDEKPKQGDWVFDTFRNACPIIRQLKTEEEVIEVQKTERKIILAADPKLIKDGVQAIGDEFLEWFTKNYKIENIEVNIIEVEDYVCSAGHTAYPTSHNEYKIIIPLTESVKEEPKHYPDS